MAKGSIYPPESHMFNDAVTGVEIRQVTTHPSIHHHPFYYIPAFDDAMRWLVFVSHRTGTPQLFVEEQATGRLIQLTDRDDINEWSLHPSHDSRFVYFTTHTGGWRVAIESQDEEQLVDFGGGRKAEGMVGAGMGTTTLSRDDRWWAIPVRHDDVARMVIVDTATGESDTICENRSIGHPEFHPQDSSLLRYGGPYDERIWVVDRDGSNHRLAYQRDVSRKEWIVHECWRPHTREILTTNWPHGVMAIDIDTGDTRWITRFNAWHPMVDPTGRFMVTDTKAPDIGLQRFDIADAVTKPIQLCETESSNCGDHWNTDHCPYDDGPVNVYAPQHTHPHPSISPDGRHVVFTSDRGGISSIYLARL